MQSLLLISGLTCSFMVLLACDVLFSERSASLGTCWKSKMKLFPPKALSTPVSLIKMAVSVVWSHLNSDVGVLHLRCL